MEALRPVAELGDPTIFARIGVMRTLNRRVERVFNPDRKETHWGPRTNPSVTAGGAAALLRVARPAFIGVRCW